MLWIFFILFSLSIGSIMGNVSQLRKIKKLEENDLKYRFIKINQGISSEQFYHLDSLALKNGNLLPVSN